MAYYADTAVSSFIGAILTRLVDEDKYFRSPAIQSELHKLKITFSNIQPLLHHASHNKQVAHRSAGLWLNNLKHLCYDLDDLLDDMATKAMHRDQLTNESDSETITSKVRQKLDSITNKVHRLEKQKLVDITIRLQKLVEQVSDLGFTVKDERPEDDMRRTYPFVLAYDVIGREAEKQKFLSKLLQDSPSEENFSVVPIVGLGGVGKSTLAAVLYEDELVNRRFEIKVWVWVSDEFDVFKISKTIFRSVTGVNEEFEDLNQLQMALVEEVKDRRFLLVLDDVWIENYDEWDELVRPFHFGARGSKMIMTTRKDQLLKSLGFERVERLQSLSHQDALSLLALHALDVDNFDSHPTYKELGERIVKKCGGLPLALRAFGRRLRTCTHEHVEWIRLLHIEIWDSPIADEIFQSFMLSYHDLSTNLKCLFQYCSLFPKGFLFDKEKLILLWLAEGYMYGSPENMGHYFFDTLLSRSFFQHAPGHESLFVMHNLMSDFATFVARDCFLRFDNQMRMTNEGLTKYRHMSFIREKYVGYKQCEELKRARSLRTLLAVSVGEEKSWNFVFLSNNILVDLLHNLPLLRVLCLSNCNICGVPDFVGSLKHLRYLNLSQTKIKELPENVGNLYNLQTLIVYGCRSLTKLPKSFSKLKKLRHFDIRETRLLKMPLGIGDLISLQTLPKIIIGEDNGFAITNLKELMNLRGELIIEGLHKVQSSTHARQANLISKRLTKLDLKWGNVYDGTRRVTLEKDVLDELKPYSNTLKELAIVSYGGMEFPNWVGDPSFLLLADISLIDCGNCTSLPPLGSLPLLKKLRIKGMHDIKVIGSDLTGDVFIAFPTLEVLVFEDMLGWEVWSRLTNSEALHVAFPCLRDLQIKNCPNLIDVSVEAMPSLKVLQIGGCGHGVLRSLVQTAASVTELQIESISGLTDEAWRGVIGYLEAVTEVRITGCNEMRYLWESEAEASMTLVNLWKLEVFECSNLVNLGETEEDYSRINLLTSLRNLEVWCCWNMEGFSCPGNIECLTIGSCSSLTHVCFPTGGQQLKSLSLYGLKVSELLLL